MLRGFVSGSCAVNGLRVLRHQLPFLPVHAVQTGPYHARYKATLRFGKIEDSIGTHSPAHLEMLESTIVDGVSTTAALRNAAWPMTVPPIAAPAAVFKNSRLVKPFIAKTPPVFSNAVFRQVFGFFQQGASRSALAPGHGLQKLSIGGRVGVSAWRCPAVPTSNRRSHAKHLLQMSLYRLYPEQPDRGLRDATI